MFINYDRRYRDQALEAGYYLDGDGNAMRRGQHPDALVDIAVHRGATEVGVGAVLHSDTADRDRQGRIPLHEERRTILRSVIAALAELTTPHAVTVTCACDYLISNMMQGCAHQWRRNGWRKPDGDPIKSRDLWKRILALGDLHLLRFVSPTRAKSVNMIRAEALAVHAMVMPDASVGRAPSAVDSDGGRQAANC